MGIMQKIKGKAERAAGAAKREVGKHTDNPNLVAEGNAEQRRGENREAIENAGQRAKAAGEIVKGKVKGAVGAITGDTATEVEGKMEATKGKMRQRSSHA